MGLLVKLSSAASQKPVIERVVICGVLLAISGCIPNLRPAELGPDLPTDFYGKTSPENSAQLTVEEFYQDPVLAGLVAQALAGNQELKLLEQEIAVASAEILGRRGAYFPFVFLRGDAGLDRHSLYTPLGAAEEQLTFPGERHFPDPLPNFLVGADFLWRIDIWRELRNARDAAIQRYFAAIEQRNFFVTKMVAEIAENYFELMSLDQRLQILNQVIALQEKSLFTAKSNFEAGRTSDLPVQRFQADIQKNQSQKLIVGQAIIQAENRINFLLGRYPQPVERDARNFINLNLHVLSVGVPADLLLYRTDIRQAERELAAAGLNVLVARARFFPTLDITGRIGFEAFNPKYVFNKDALVGNIAGGLVGPFINRAAIKADYYTANAKQLQALYNYQRVILNAFTQVANNMAKAENFGRSVELKKGQLASLEIAVDVANKLFLSNRAEYIEVLFTQRDLLEARTVLVETKQQQLSAIINTYQALGGGVALSTMAQYPDGFDCPPAEPQPGLVPSPPPPPVPGENAGGKESSPYEPTPGKKPGQEAPSSQHEPTPDKKPGQEEPLPKDDTPGPANIPAEKTDLEPVPRAERSQDANALLAPPVIEQSPPVNHLRDDFAAPRFQRVETTSFSAQFE